VRPVDEDLFRLGTEEAMVVGLRSAALLSPVQSFADLPVDAASLRWAVGAALTAEAVRFVHLADRVRRKEFLDELGAPDVLYEAPEIVLPFTVGNLVAGGASVQRLLVALAAEGLGACVVPLGQADRVRALLELPDTWVPLGAVAIGRPRAQVHARPETDPDDRFLQR